MTLISSKISNSLSSYRVMVNFICDPNDYSFCVRMCMNLYCFMHCYTYRVCLIQCCGRWEDVSGVMNDIANETGCLYVVSSLAPYQSCTAKFCCHRCFREFCCCLATLSPLSRRVQQQSPVVEANSNSQD